VTDQTTEAPVSQATVIAALECAVIALGNAAERVAGRYGRDAEHVAQLAGAAAMINDDWLPTIRKEPADA